MAASAVFERRRGLCGIGVIALPHMSNFTDFDPLSREPAVSLAYLTSPDDVARADVLVLPGTKQTLDDLAWLNERGLTAAITARASRGGLTVGICGGMQMLGARISDPDDVEGGGERDGLGLLPIETTLARHKVTVQSRGTLCDERLFGVPIGVRDITGYEIHVGVTRMHDEAKGFARLTRGANASGRRIDRHGAARQPHRRRAILRRPHRRHLPARAVR